MIPFVVFSMRRAWQGFWRNALMSLAATLTMVLMLLLLAGFFILQNVLLASLSFVEQKVEVVAYLENTATDDQVQTLISDTEAMPAVASVEFVSRDEALERFRATQEAQGRTDLTQYLESNPLYASLNVKLVSPTELQTVTEALEQDEIVRNVLNIQALVNRVLTVTDVVRTAGVAMVGIVGLIVLFIIVNTIRLAVVARAEEIEIMRLVGASDAFIRWPFVFEGALVGLLGALLTLGLLWATSDPLSQAMVGFFNVLPLELGSVARDTVILVMGTGVGLGILGSWVSVRTYLIR
ncbi:MAG TPA: permease-like cell division protein FtsX [Candidatus Limnocylindrales bacterium]|nr:permease-like cell division protein FtsX [Candidatus Limnocylindrales bacterium]